MGSSGVGHFGGDGSLQEWLEDGRLGARAGQQPCLAVDARELDQFRGDQRAAAEVPRIGIIGYSLGANLALLALGRNARRIPEAVRAAVAAARRAGIPVKINATISARTAPTLDGLLRFVEENDLSLSVNLLRSDSSSPAIQLIIERQFMNRNLVLSQLRSDEYSRAE